MPDAINAAENLPARIYDDIGIGFDINIEEGNPPNVADAWRNDELYVTEIKIF